MGVKYLIIVVFGREWHARGSRKTSAASPFFVKVIFSLSFPVE